MAIEVKSSFRLVGDSTLWIISRSNDIADSNAVICKIRKEADSQRIFLLFGSAVGYNGEFKFFKKQEIPTLNDFTTEALLEDYVDIKLKYVDNGDDRVMVQGAISGHQKRLINMVCSMFIPVFDLTKLMLAGSGASILMKQISLRFIERDHKLKSGV